MLAWALAKMILHDAVHPSLKALEAEVNNPPVGPCSSPMPRDLW